MTSRKIKYQITFGLHNSPTNHIGSREYIYKEIKYLKKKFPGIKFRITNEMINDENRGLGSYPIVLKDLIRKKMIMKEVKKW